MGESVSQASQHGPVILPKMEMCPISQLRPKERPDKRENPLETCTNNGVFAGGGLPTRSSQKSARTSRGEAWRPCHWMASSPGSPTYSTVPCWCAPGGARPRPPCATSQQTVLQATRAPPRAASVLCQKLQR